MYILLSLFTYNTVIIVKFDITRLGLYRVKLWLSLKDTVLGMMNKNKYTNKVNK